MREIKFRAWTSKDMVQIDVLSLTPGPWSSEGRTGVSISYQPSVKVMQYTGLKDCNGVEIYERDILCINECISRGDGTFDDDLVVVHWNDPDYGYFVRGESYYNFLAAISDYEFQVVGNTYQTPDLLEVSA